MFYVKRTLASFFAVGLLLWAGAPALAQDGDGFHFWMDPIELEALNVSVDTNSAKFQEYRDLSSGFRLPVLNLYGESADGNRYLEFRGTNVDREDARYTVHYGVGGSYSFKFDYNKIRHRFGNDAYFLWSENKPGYLAIPDSIQANLQKTLDQQFATNASAIGFDYLNALISPYLEDSPRVDLGLVRNRTFARVDVHKMQTWAYAVEVRHENRNGERPYAGSFGFGNSVEVYEPIDYETTDLEASASWNGEQAGMRFGYRHSDFSNNISTFVWDNPWYLRDGTDGSAYTSPGSRTVNGSSRGFADLAPDNTADLFFVNGRAKFGGGWKVNGSVSYNTMKQDEPLLPYTLNTAIVGIDEHTGATFDPTNIANLPTRNADNEANVLNFAATLMKDFGEDWDLKLSYRYYDYDNQSARIEFPGYVRFHAVWEEVPRITVPYAYTRDDLGAELGWDASDKTKVTFSYHLKNYDREFREVDSADEDIFAISVDSRISEKFGVRAKWENGDRSIDDYSVEAQLFSFAGEEEVNNLYDLRKYDEAARQFDNIDVKLDFYPADEWQVTVGASTRDDDYDESDFGLVSDELNRYYGEINYTPSASLNLYLFGDVADRESLQLSRNSGGTVSEDPIDDWSLTLDENNDTWGFGLNSAFSEDWTIDISANWSKSDGGADFGSPPGGAEVHDIDNYEDIELFAVHFKLDYSFSERCTVGLTYLYEDYTIDSFNLTGLLPYLPSTLSLAANNGDYQADVYGIRFKFSF